MQPQLPEKFLEKLSSYVPEEKLPAVVNAFTHKRNTSFRTNTLKTTSTIVAQQLHLLGFDIEQISWYKDAFVLQNKSKEELMNTKLYKEGKIYIQNISSMLPALALEPNSDDTILDMAASPGSKTTQLACLMQNSGFIIANDKSPKRIYKLIENLKTQGVTNTKVTTAPGEFLWKKYLEYFDKVLVDTPCSMEGRFYTNDPDSYKDWSPRKVKELSNLQKWLLRSAISCTKVGGVIVYSTCAMSPEENEDVIHYMLKKLGSAITLETITIPYLEKNNGLASWKHLAFLNDLTKTIRIYPNALMEGFFVAKIRKVLPTT